jgi:hypothetical protein
MKSFKILPLILSAVYFSGCESLEVKNLNTPDTRVVLEDPEDVINVVAGTFRRVYNCSYDLGGTRGLSTSLACMADQLTSAAGDGGIVDMSKEPRIAWDNQKDARWLPCTGHFWRDLYSTVSQCLDVLDQLNSGMVVMTENGSQMNDAIRAYCYFIVGLCHGHIALVFDRGYYLSPESDIENPELITYSVLMDSAIACLNRSIEISLSHSFSIPDGWINGKTYDNHQFAQIASSYAARFLLAVSRNRSQDQEAEWDRILAYADNGIDFDFDPLSDYDNYWQNLHVIYGSVFQWCRVDLRIIHLMDTTYPSRWPVDNESWNTPDGKHPGMADTLDVRIGSDFEYVEWIEMPPDRGYYRFSNYVITKFDHLYDALWVGNIPIFLKAENELIRAEALIKSNDDVSGAISILNEGTRITRGKLDPLEPGSTEQEVLDAIFYERDVELMFTGLGISFFDMRRRDMLQPGTLLHFPVPGDELSLLLIENYTFGGDKGTPGEDYSIGGWF